MPKVTVYRSILQPAVNAVCLSAEKPDSARPALEHIRIEVRGATRNKLAGTPVGAGLTLTTADGWQMTQVYVPGDNPTDARADILIPAASLARYLKALPRRGADSVVLAWDETGHATVSCGDQVLDVPFSESLRYPDADRLVPPIATPYRCKVAAGDLWTLADSITTLTPSKLAVPCTVEIAPSQVIVAFDWQGLSARVTCNADTSELTSWGSIGVDPAKLGKAARAFDGAAEHITLAWGTYQLSPLAMRGTIPGGLVVFALIMPMTMTKR